MNKELTPLEALDTLVTYFYGVGGGYIPAIDTIKTALKDYEKKTKLAKEYADVDNVAKRLKALEIIKEKQIVMPLFYVSLNKEMYNRELKTDYELAQEEFDLLKEVLK